MTKEDQILHNQKVLAKAMMYLIWKNWPLNPAPDDREMRKELAKLAGVP